MWSCSRGLCLILLLLFAAAGPQAFDVSTCADGWEQLDDARAEALPVAKVSPEAWAGAEPRTPERGAATPLRVAEAEIFRPPIG